jgi:hypothetical protein
MHDDDSYPSEWCDKTSAPNWDDREPPKTAGLTARTREFLLLIATGDVGVVRRVMDMSNDAVNLDQVPELVMSLGCAYVEQAFACHGRDTTIARLKSDVEHARQEAIEEARQ